MHPRTATELYRQQNLQLCQSAPEELSLRIIRRQGDGAHVGGPSLVSAPKPAQEIGPRGMERLIAIQHSRQRRHQLQASRRAFSHRHRYSTI